MIGYHSNLKTIKIHNKKYCFQIFYGSPYKYDVEKNIKYNIDNIFYIHSKYIGNILKNNKLKIQSIKNEIEFLKQNNLTTGVVLHLYNNNELTHNQCLEKCKTIINSFEKDSKLILIETPDYIEYLGNLTDMKYLSLTTNCNFCLDTCHIYLTDRDISSYRYMIDYITDFMFMVGIDRLKLIHLNDSNSYFGGTDKKHESILKGNIFKIDQINLNKMYSLDVIKILEKHFNIDIIFERHILENDNEEILFYKNYKLSSTKYDKILNDLVYSLILKYLLYYSENLYDINKQNKYLEAYNYLSNNILIFYKNKKILPVINYPIKGSIYDLIMYIASNFKSNKVVYDKLKYLTEEQHKVLLKNNYYTTEDIIENIETINKLIHNKQFFTYMKYFKDLKEIDKIIFKKLIDNIPGIITGSYIRKKVDKIKDLDILITTNKLDTLMQYLDNKGKVLDYIRNGNSYKQLIYNYLNNIVIIDLFIFDQITDEIIINYSLSKKENKYYKHLAKLKDLKLTNTGLYDKKKNRIKYSTISELKLLLS